MDFQENKPILFGLSNTFINCFAVASQSLLDKYGLVFGADVELTQEQTKVFEDLEMLEGYQEIAGGSTLNTIRAFSFMMKKNYQRNHSALFFGSIGTDTKGETVKRLFDEEKIDYRFDEHDGYSTDQCAIIIVNSERTPVSFCRVNQLIRTQHVIDNIDYLSSCKIFYTDGYFVSSNYDAIKVIIKQTEANGACFAFNIGAEFWLETYSDKIINILSHADLLFGNYHEFKTLAKILGTETTSIEECIRVVASYKPSRDDDSLQNEKQSRLVLMTMDKDGAILDNYSFITEIHEIVKVPSIKLEEHEVVDACCAGDSFVGGFLSGYINGKDYESSMKDGHEIAAKVIQKVGCFFE